MNKYQVAGIHCGLLMIDDERMYRMDREFSDYKKMGIHLNQLIGSSSSIGAKRLRNVCVAFRAASEQHNRAGSVNPFTHLSPFLLLIFCSSFLARSNLYCMSLTPLSFSQTLWPPLPAFQFHTIEKQQYSCNLASWCLIFYTNMNLLACVFQVLESFRAAGTWLLLPQE